MKRLLVQSMLVLALSLSVLILILAAFSPRITQARIANTSICGTIYTNTTWTVISSPYQVCNSSSVTVGPTATLTIQPGVVVQFQAGVNSGLYVQGALSAIGTVTQPITFTGVITAPGSWAGILADHTIVTPALVNLSYVTLEDGGAGSAHAQLNVDRAVLTLTHSLIRNSSTNGLHFTYQTPGFDVQSTGFVSNALSAIQIDQPTMDLLLSDLSAADNGTNGVYIVNVSTYVQGQRRWANPGIPYVIDDQIINQPGDVLTIDPGSELQFMPNAVLKIGGRLEAIGLPDQPITFTAQSHAPAGWLGLIVDGGTANAIAQLDYATIEHGGGGSSAANVTVNHGQLIAHHSTIRYGAKDGARFIASATGSILNSQIVSNSQTITTSYGIYVTDPTREVILATNDWWGDPNGPKSDVPGCSIGQGSQVTDGVLFRPVLTDTNLNAEFPLSDAPQLTLTPRRWFAPADGVTRVYFDITVRDGNGAPLAGYTTHLHTSLGSVVDGGLTDVTGHALGYLYSSLTGDANVFLTLDPNITCQGAGIPTTKITFTPPITITDLFPDSPAPYVNNDLSVTPLPVVSGITETVHAKLTNPLTVPITVDVDFAYVQSSVGLAFGPIKSIVGQMIPPSSTVSLSADFMPLITGHYCVQVSYDITAIGSLQLLRPEQNKKSGQLNMDARPGPTIPINGKDTLNRADKSWKIVEKMAPNGTQVQTGVLDGWWTWVKDAARWAAHELGLDPPRQDYNVTTVPVWHRWPHIQPDANVSIARANAHNAVSDALADVVAYGTAAATAFDRYSGASAANDLTWSSEQVNAQLHYQQQMGTALMTYADALDAFTQVLVNEGETNLAMTAADVISYQQRLATTGFTPDEIAAAKLVGLTDDDIEAYRQETIAADPNSIAGNLLDIYANEAFVSRNLGDALLHPNAFVPGGSVTGGGGLLRMMSVMSGTGNTLAQIGNTSTTIQVGNPLTQTSLIDLRARRIDLPADWAVDISPAQMTLAPGEIATVTVNILTGSLAPQGSVPRVAVEGYAGNQLLGGVAVDVIVPNYVPYFLHAYLPLIRK